MPLIALACLAYAGGLAAGLTLSTAVATLAIALGLATGAGALLAPSLGIVRNRALCAMLAAGGALVATGARTAEGACTASALPPYTAVLEQDARPGAVIQVTARRESCRLRTTVIVAQGSGHAGESVRVSGEAVRMGERLLLRDARVEVVGGGLSLARLRARVGRRIDRVFGDDAPLVRALVIADMSAVPAEQRDRFARAGLVHMLSVSGLHVGIVALALELLAIALRVPRTAARTGTMAVLAAYVALIGAPAPAVRAAMMLGLVLLTRLLQRPASAWAILAVGSTVPLADPRTVLDLGWQLSVAGTIALVAGGALARRTLPRGWRGMRRGVATAAIVSVTATIATAPLVAWTFGRLSLVGPLSNLLADPVMGLLQPVLFLALLIPVPAVEGLAAGAAHLLILAFDAIATRAASLPFAAPVVLPSALGALAAGVASLAFVAACIARRPGRPMVAALAAAAVMTVEPLLPHRRAATELHLLDVGQGDAAALRTRAGRWIVFDAGRTWAGGDAGRSVLVPYLSHRGGAVALFVLSHPHADHVGGAATLIGALRPGRFLDPGFVGGSPSYLAALEAARAGRVPWQRVRPGDSLVVDEVVLTALAPDSAWASTLDDANLASAVVLARVGSVRMLFTGDAEEPEEEWLLAHSPGALAADVLKVGHHGSRTSTTPRFLDAVRPRLALVSVGAGNRYGHPSADVMSALAGSGSQVLRTDQVGTVVVRTDGREIEVEARGARWPVPARPRR